MVEGGGKEEDRWAKDNVIMALMAAEGHNLLFREI